MRGHHQHNSGHTISGTRRQANAEKMFNCIDAIHWYESKTTEKIQKHWILSQVAQNVYLLNTGFSSLRSSIINLSFQNIAV